MLNNMEVFFFRKMFCLALRKSKTLLFSHLLLVFTVSLFSNSLVIAEESTVPSPLSLDKAINYAVEHPRTQLTFKELQQHPTKQAVFLDCHNVTFNNASRVDNKRNTIQSNLIDPTERQKLQILQSFLDVSLADLNLIVINENMAGTYIDFDRAKTRAELKELSERVVANLNAEYQVIRQQYFASGATQRLTRSILAQAINHPTQLPSELNDPKSFKVPKELPELDNIYQKALINNNWINELKKKIGKEQFSLIEMELRQEILELLLRLDVLKSAKERADTDNYRRELNLDMSRTLYDMEVKASLGDSMTLQSQANLDDIHFSYCQLFTWAQLNVLQGLPILKPPAKKTDKEPQD